MIKKSAMESQKSPLRTMLIEMMQEQNISQAEMARRIGVTRQEVNNFLSGRQVISFDKLERICQELKIL